MLAEYMMFHLVGLYVHSNFLIFGFFHTGLLFHEMTWSLLCLYMPIHYLFCSLSASLPMSIWALYFQDTSLKCFSLIGFVVSTDKSMKQIQKHRMILSPTGTVSAEMCWVTKQSETWAAAAGGLSPKLNVIPHLMLYRQPGNPLTLNKARTFSIWRVWYSSTCTICI